MKQKLRFIWKIFSSVMLVMGIMFFISIGYLLFNIMRFSDETVPYDVNATKLNMTSFIYVDDGNGNFVEYDKIHGVENRIWADFKDIPKWMKLAAIAIEDKRFYQHNGVDIKRTIGAMSSLINKNSNGGSSLTQQLIKNLSGDNGESLLRKIKEIFRARNFEKQYSKDEILEAYLNVVYFGEGCRGVQAAAKMYFSKDVKECSIAECAAIIGITQNPSKYNPFDNPDDNKKRREIVIDQMHEQGLITDDEYNNAMNESETLEFKKGNSIRLADGATRNWYTDMVLCDVAKDLCEKYELSEETAWEMICTQGLQIYSAMDMDAQNACDAMLEDGSILPSDKDFELGYMMMGFDGRILANLGSRNKKKRDLDFDNSIDAVRQPGSTIKPIGVYAPAIDKDLCTYSSIIPGKKIDNFYGNAPGPNGRLFPDMPLQKCVQWSSNVAAARVLQLLTPMASYNFMTEKLGFKHLDRDTDGCSLVGLALGGLTKGATVKEMTAAFQIFGNGGKYNEPYSYFYVKDKQGKILLDNRNKEGIQAISSETATIMNLILRSVITSGTGTAANISGWELYGKTGTTDSNDSWFIAASPYAVAGVWTGYKNPRPLPSYEFAKNAWREIMVKYLSKKGSKSFVLNPGVKRCYYDIKTGLPVGTEAKEGCEVGYYKSKYDPTKAPNVWTGSTSEMTTNQSSVQSTLDMQSVPTDLITVEEIRRDVHKIRNRKSMSKSEIINDD